MVPASPAKAGRYVLPETVAIAALGLVDLLYTCYLIATGAAHEGNPLMAGALRQWGPTGFVVAKAALIGVPLCVVELARPHHPKLVTALLRVALILYAAGWTLGVIAVNRSP
ncbi:MAG: hypothetical protein FJX72_01680 [Armatimonadetes bacterium]|nr:hypothetical protein [Armatimonadota bacterium]